MKADASHPPHRTPSRPVVIDRSGGTTWCGLAELWKYRDLLMVLTARDVRVRYKQTVVGFAWALLKPFITMVVFTIFLGNLSHVPSEGVPYPVFSFCGLLIWVYFSTAIDQAGQSLVQNQVLVSKIYFPRMIAPLAGVLSPLVDFGVSLLILAGLMAWYRTPVYWTILLIPVFTASALLVATGIGLVLSAVSVSYRDVRHATPLIIQLWLFVTPVVYPASLVPNRYRLLYSLNPATGIVTGSRWAIIQDGHFPASQFGMSIGVGIVLLLVGSMYFRRVERNFADVL